MSDSTNKRSALSMFGNFVFVAALASCAMAGGAALTQFYHSPATPVDHKAEIIGPDRIEFAGQLALFRASVPGASPKELVYVWGVESIGEPTTTYGPELVPTANAGEIQLTTVAGRWRLWCSITDPSTRSGQMLSRQVVIPGDASKPIPPKPAPPEPSPLPAPSPVPTPPAPPAPSPIPAPANRFSELTTDVRTWLADVNSPNKIGEVAALRSGALAIVDRLQTGDLAKSSGMSLEMSVVRAVQASNSDAIKQNPAAWKGFAGKVGTYAGSALSAKKLTTAADWAEMLRAFADGLQ